MALKGSLKWLLPLGLIAGAILVEGRRRRLRALQKTKDSLIPTAPYSGWKSLEIFTSRKFPELLLTISREIQSPVARFLLPFGHEAYIIFDHELTLSVLQERANDKPAWFTSLHQLTAGYPNIFSSLTRDPHWQINRKHVARAFALGTTMRKVHSLEDKVKEFSAILAEHCITGVPVDIADLLTCLTLDFIGLSAFDYEMNGLRGGADSDGRMFMHMLEICQLEFVLKQPLNPLRAWMFWDPEIREARRAVQWLQNLALRIINHYRATHSAAEIQEEESIMAHLLRNENYADDKARAADVTIMLVGGYETTANTLAWTLYDLARHPNYQKQLRDELDALYDSCEKFSPTELVRLPRLNRCLKESMRLWPVAPSVDRVLSSPITKDGATIPKGAEVSVPLMALFRPSWLDHPDEYEPERWVDPSPDLESLVIPFSHGARSCVGQNLAYLELRMVLAHVVRQFSFEVAQEPEVDMAMLMKPKGLLLRITQQQTTL